MIRRSALLVALAVCASLAVPALAAGPVRITAERVGKVRLGAKHETLKARDLLGRQRPGCELAGPSERVAKLKNGAQGFANLTDRAPRRVESIFVRGGAEAKGVGVGDTKRAIKAKFPHAKFDSSTEATFRFTLVRVPVRDGGRFQFTLSTETRRITSIGVPRIVLCD